MIYKKKAFALSIVLWIVMILFLSIVFIASISKDNLNNTYMLKDKLNSQIILNNYFEALKYYILTSTNNGRLLSNNENILELPNSIIVDGRDYKINKNITISVQDVSSLVSYTKLYTFLDVKKYHELYISLIDTINDWLDIDNIQKLNGAESSYYIKHKFAYIVPNVNLLQSIDELKLIKGVRELGILYGKDYKKEVTYRYTHINFLLIDKKRLASLLHLTLTESTYLIQLRDKNYKQFINIIEKNKYFNDSYMDFSLSYIFRIKIRVKLDSNVQSKLSTVIYTNKQETDKILNIDNYKIY